MSVENNKVEVQYEAGDIALMQHPENDAIRWTGTYSDGKWFTLDGKWQEITSYEIVRICGNVNRDYTRNSATEQMKQELPDFESVQPFVYDPATGFIHADDGGAPENGIKWVREEYATAEQHKPLVERCHKALVELLNGQDLLCDPTLMQALATIEKEQQ